MQDKLDGLEDWTNKHLMKFNKAQCKVLHLGKHNPGLQHSLGSTQLRNSPLERDLGIPVDSKLGMSEHCPAVAEEADRRRVCINKAITSPYDTIKKSLSYSVQHLSVHTWYCVQLWSLLYKKDADRLETVQRRATKLNQDWEAWCEKRLTELHLSSLEKRKLGGDLRIKFQYLKDGHKEDRHSLVKRNHMEKVRGNG
ncbi:hypothetical protein WISP_149182 [Willisornis vidua]|uniref:Rna-directed dna polymerase from mobile element jockey-like n=1 Tax=Willisornis vidua TaxID=1566151 RepID=A0ABQ9CK32_9PASS|nr:hypothetical protein WISP_149182 [Willisornis vidua]